MKKIIFLSLFSFILLSPNFSLATTYPTTCPDVAQTILTSFGGCSAINCSTYSNICAKCCIQSPIQSLTCTSFTYYNWSVCQSNNTQNRTVASKSPSGCTGGSPITSQACSYIPPTPKTTPLPTKTPTPSLAPVPTQKPVVVPTSDTSQPNDAVNPFDNEESRASLRNWEAKAGIDATNTSTETVTPIPTETVTPISQKKSFAGFVEFVINIFSGFFGVFGLGK